MLIGFLVGLSEIHNIGDVVVGTLAAAGILTGIGFGWQRLRGPRLTLECGNTHEFNIAELVTAEEREIAGGREVLGVYAKLLIIRVRRGAIAREVSVSVDAVTPLPPTYRLPIPLRFIGRELTRDIHPRHRVNVILQEIFLVAGGETSVHGAVFAGHGSRTVEIPGDTVYFTISVSVSGRRVLQKDFRMVNPWPGVFAVSEYTGPFPIPAAAYPSVYEN